MCYSSPPPQPLLALFAPSPCGGVLSSGPVKDAQGGRACLARVRVGASARVGSGRVRVGARVRDRVRVRVRVRIRLGLGLG